MGYQQNRLAPAANFSELVETLVGEAFVTDRQNFVDEEDVGIDVNRDGKAEPHVHPR